MVVVLKLGGSVLTEKTARETLASEALDTIASTIERHRPSDLIIVHGGGSFGHPAAVDGGVSRIEPTRNARAIHAIGQAMRRLNDAVIARLSETPVSPIGLSPRGIARKDEDGELTISTDALTAMLAEGFLPVVYGDVIVHRNGGASIVGGDGLGLAIAGELEADRVGFCSDVPGVLDADGTVIERIERFEAVAAVLDAPAGDDVTGGIAWKLESLLAAETPGAIFGIDELSAFLDGELPGTRVEREPD